MRKLLSFLFLSLFIFSLYADEKDRMVKLSTFPEESAIYIDDNIKGYGEAYFLRPLNNNSKVIIRIECFDHIPIIEEFYGFDKRNKINYHLIENKVNVGPVKDGLNDEKFIGP